MLEPFEDHCKIEEIDFAMVPFCVCDEPKSVLARDLGDRLQSRNVPFGTSGD